jgi:hypothetical protein
MPSTWKSLDLMPALSEPGDSATLLWPPTFDCDCCKTQLHPFWIQISQSRSPLATEMQIFVYIYARIIRWCEITWLLQFFWPGTRVWWDQFMHLKITSHIDAKCKIKLKAAALSSLNLKNLKNNKFWSSLLDGTSIFEKFVGYLNLHLILKIFWYMRVWTISMWKQNLVN